MPLFRGLGFRVPRPIEIANSEARQLHLLALPSLSRCIIGSRSGFVRVSRRLVRNFCVFSGWVVLELISF